MGKKPKDRHRRETQREAELALERERDLKRAARRQKAEAKLAAAGLAVGGPSALTASPSMEVEGPANPSLEPTLRKKGTSKRKVGKSDIDLAVRKALPRLKGSGMIAKRRPRTPYKLMKKQMKRVAQSSGMDTTYMAVAQTRRCAGEI